MTKATLDLNPSMPGVAAASEVLHDLIRRLRRRMQKVNRAEHEAEDVHQLRVSTRRLVIALSVFRQVLPRNRRKALERTTNKLRQASGEVRDIDVLRGVVEERVNAGEITAEAAAPLQRTLDRRGEHADRTLLQDTRRLAGKFERRAKRLKRRLPKPADVDVANPHPALIDVARDAVDRRLGAFTTAANADLHDLQRLHELRIAAKHLRYAMEIVTSCFPPRFGGELHQMIESLQSRLGRINDLRNLVTLAKEIAAKKGNGRLQLIEAICLWNAELRTSIEQFVQDFRHHELNRILHIFTSLLKPSGFQPAPRTPLETAVSLRSIELREQLQSN